MFHVEHYSHVSYLFHVEQKELPGNSCRKNYKRKGSRTSETRGVFRKLDIILYIVSAVALDGGYFHSAALDAPQSVINRINKKSGILDTAFCPLCRLVLRKVEFNCGSVAAAGADVRI